MEERGSKLGYGIGLIFGIVFLIIGLSISGYVAYKIIKVTLNNDVPATKTYYYGFVAIGFYLCVMSVWIMAASVWMRSYPNMKNGYLISIIVGTFSLNIFAVCAGIIGRIDYTYLTRIRDMQPKLFG